MSRAIQRAHRISRQLIPSNISRGFAITMDKKESITNWVDPKDKSGEFKRQSSVFRNWISNKSGAQFPAEKDRYHLCELD